MRRIPKSTPGRLIDSQRLTVRVDFFVTIIVISSDMRDVVSFVKPSTEVDNFTAFAAKRCGWH